MVVGVFCALLLVTSTVLAADTAVKTTNTPVAVETVKAEAPADAWVMTLGGVGSTATAGDKESVFGIDMSLGRTGKLLFPIEGGIRQTVSFANDNNVATTKLYMDWDVLKVKWFDLFVGGNFGCSYGNTTLVWSAAPEVGVRAWVKKDVALYGRAEFPFNLNDSRFNETVKYAIGIQFRF